MNNSFENKIRIKAALIYIVVAVVLGGMIFFIYLFRKDIDNQKNTISRYQYELTLTDSLVSMVSKAQSEANRYVITKRVINFEKFREYMSEIEEFTNFLMSSDSLKTSSQELGYIGILTEINDLLADKGRVIIRLNQQFNRDNPIDSVSEKLNTYDPVINEDSLIVKTTIKKDTLINTVSRKGFWKRLSEVFSPNKKRDTVIAISTMNIDTLKVQRSDSLLIIAEAGEIASQAKEDYIEQMDMIKNQVKHLLLADQEISSKITNLLIELYNQTVHLRLKEFQKSEQLVRINNIYSIALGIIALILILVFILLIIADVSKGYAARKALEKANALAQQIMESRHKLLLSVSHDIKTPLNSILGYLELNKGHHNLSGQDIHSMQNSGKHILALLENLLEFSSLEQGTVMLVEKDFRLKELSVEVVEMFRPLALQKSLEFTYNMEFDNNLAVHSDPLKMKQIMINILSNSIKYTLSGKVSFCVSYQENNLCVEVEDTGIGIPEEQIPILFMPFARVEKSSTLVEGRGLGLYVVKGLVDLLSGEIRVSSVVGKGTNIKVRIPVKKVVDIKENNNKQQRKIIIIDDDPAFSAMLREMFLQLGHNPEVCGSVDEFRSKLDCLSDSDIIITDMEMGISSGSDVLKIVRDAGLHLPVVVMTAHCDFNEKMALEMGFYAYSCKPVTVASLYQLFGGQMDTYYDSSLLSDMFNDDWDTINEVLEIFIRTTEENIDLLKQSLQSGNFKLSQAICHKMLPMFMQIGAKNGIQVLQKMDSLHSEDAQIYPEWKEDLANFISKAEELVLHLRLEISKN